MPITKFKITRAPVRATLEIETVPFVLDQEYPIAKQAQMVAKVSGIGVPYDNFGFKLGNDNGIWSPEYNCTINANVGAGAPSCNDIDIDVELFALTNITSLFVFDDNSDRIQFTEESLPRYGTLKINGIDLIVNKIYYKYEFLKVFWFAEYNGLLPNVVSTLKFRFGNKDIWGLDCTLTLTSTANLQGIINVDPLTDDDFSQPTVYAEGTLTNKT